VLAITIINKTIIKNEVGAFPLLINMSLVKGFLLRIQKYLERGVIHCRQSFNLKETVSHLLEGIFEMMNFSEAHYVSMVVYFERLIQRHSGLINENNMIRLIFISGVMALKMFDDFSYKNSYFAQISGVSVQELNFLELKFLEWIDYKLVINEEEYQRYHFTLAN